MSSIITGLYSTWKGWIGDSANASQDEATKLAALREFIVLAARRAVSAGDIGADWANKKFPGLGITERISTEHAYELEAPVTAMLRMTIYAGSRADAEAEFARRAANGSLNVTNIATAAAPAFISGPYDVDPSVLPDDAPTTVDGTLAALRRAIMLGHVAGPKFCRDGANDLLEEFGLDELPPTVKYDVVRPAEVEMKTTVLAYDPVTAAQVAEWRWDNNGDGYKLAKTGEAGDFQISPA